MVNGEIFVGLFFNCAFQFSLCQSPHTFQRLANLDQARFRPFADYSPLTIDHSPKKYFHEVGIISRQKNDTLFLLIPC
jgi:hypothetical protein